MAPIGQSHLTSIKRAKDGLMIADPSKGRLYTDVRGDDDKREKTQEA